MSERATLTRQQTADYLNMGLNTLDKLIARREYPLPHIRAGRRVIIPRQALEAWIQAEIERQTSAD